MTDKLHTERLKRTAREKLECLMLAQINDERAAQCTDTEIAALLTKNAEALRREAARYEQA